MPLNKETKPNQTAGPHYPNFLYQLMAIQSSTGSSHLRPGAFHMFYKYTTDMTYITKSWRKKNKQAWTWVSSKHKKGEVLALFWYSVAIMSVYPNKIPIQLPGTLALPLVLADLASGLTSPNSLLQQPPLSNCHLSLAVANSCLFTALEPCLSSFSSGLVGNLMHKPFVWVSLQNRQRNPLTGTHPQNKCPPLGHIIMITICIILFYFSFLDRHTKKQAYWLDW